MTKIILFLVEGATEQALYVKILEKLNAKKISCEKLPSNIHFLLKTLRKPYSRLLCLCRKETILAVMDCGGYKQLEMCLRELLRSELITNALNEGLSTIIIASDRKHKPIEGIKGLLASIIRDVKLNYREINKGLFIVQFNKVNVKLVVIEEGLEKHKHPNATEQIEDHLEPLAKTIYPRLWKYVKTFKLNTKQTIGIIAALTSNYKGSPEFTAILIEKASLNQLKQHLTKILKTIENELPDYHSK